MKVKIDREGCIECGSCQALCPEVFIVEFGEKSRLLEEFQKGSPGEGEVPPELENCAKEAAEACPVQVIHVG